MSKTSVVIVDTDESLLMPLLSKILDEFSTEIQLEVITEKEYLREYFQTFREIDLLVIAEKDYQISTNQHDIKKTIVLSENLQKDKSQEKVIYMYRFSKISVIVNAILSFLLSQKEAVKTKVIVVTSAAGGEGKTLLSLGIVKNLILAQKEALYINADWIQNLDTYIEGAISLTTEEMFQLIGIGNTDINFFDSYIREQNGIKYLSGSMLSLASFSRTTQWYVELIKKLVNTKKYQYLVVDTNSCLDHVKLELASICDKLVVTTKEGIGNETCMGRLVSNLNISLEKCLFVRNMSEDFDKCVWLPNGELIRFIANICKTNVEDKSILDSIAEQFGCQSITYMLL